MGLKERTCRPSRTCTGLPGTGTGASRVTSPRTTSVSLGTVRPEQIGAAKLCEEQNEMESHFNTCIKTAAIQVCKESIGLYTGHSTVPVHGHMRHASANEAQTE